MAGDGIPELRELWLHETQFPLPGTIRIDATNLPEIDAVVREFEMVVMLPTGNQFPYWVNGRGLVWFHDPEALDVSPSGLIQAAAGFQVLGEAAPVETDFEGLRRDAVETCCYLTPQLEAVMRLLAGEVRQRIMAEPPGTMKRYFFRFANPADWYEFALLLVHAACWKYHKEFDRGDALDGFEQWWHEAASGPMFCLPHDYARYLDTQAIHASVIPAVRAARPSFP